MNCQEFLDRLGSHLDQTLPESERRAFGEHQASCPTCQREFQKTASLVSGLKGFYAGLSVLNPPSPKFRFPERPAHEAASAWKTFLHWMSPSFLKFAAGMAVVLCIVGVFFRSARHPLSRDLSIETGALFTVSHGTLEPLSGIAGSSPHAQPRPEFIARVDSRLSVPGWGTVDVASGTRIGFPSEEVAIDHGTARFSVTHGGSRRISTPQLRVAVVGTVFTVRALDDVTGIEVNSGRIQVEWAGKTALLIASRSAIVSRGAYQETVFRLPLWDSRSQEALPHQVPENPAPPVVSAPPASSPIQPSATTPAMIDPASGSTSSEPDARVTNPEEVFSNGQ